MGGARAWVPHRRPLPGGQAERPFRAKGWAAHFLSGVACILYIHTHIWGWVKTYLLSILMGWTSIYQLFWCSPGVQGFDTLPYIYIHVYYESWFYHILVLGSFYFQNGSNDNHRRAGIVVECGSPTATGSTGPLSLSAQNLAFATCLQSSWCPLILQFYWDLPKIFVLLQWELKNVCWSMRFATAPALLFSSGQLADRRRVQRKSKKRKPRTS